MPRLTNEDIENVIKKEDYWLVPGTMSTCCALVLTNGMVVIGDSHCLTPENFSIDTGRQEARKVAVNQVWMLESYMLKQRLFCFGK